MSIETITREDFERVLFDANASKKIVEALHARQKMNPKFSLKDLRAEILGGKQRAEGSAQSSGLTIADFAKAAIDVEVGRRVMAEVARRQQTDANFTAADLRAELEKEANGGRSASVPSIGVAAPAFKGTLPGISTASPAIASPPATVATVFSPADARARSIRQATTFLIERVDAAMGTNATIEVTSEVSAATFEIQQCARDLGYGDGPHVDFNEAFRRRDVLAMRSAARELLSVLSTGPEAA
jgi:hypothetical protein